MRERAVFLAFLAGGVVSLAACPAPAVNPDPVHGGQCGNGDQLATLCPNKRDCCPDGYMCATDGFGCEIDPSQWGPGDVGNDFAARRGDAGRR